MNNLLGRTVVLLAMLGMAVGVVACRDDEQNRPLVKQKGTYEGPADEKLDAEQVETLRSRASGQRF